MDIVLETTETRVLGCLIEKEMTTPEHYPLSLNALTNACNQKSNRNPVLALNEADVLKGLEGLKRKGLALETRSMGDRVAKYYHELLSRFDLGRQELAVLCDLMLRGPQTPGELRVNAGRMAPFESLAETEKTLQTLMAHDPPLVIRLEREAGRKESRCAHLLSGAIKTEKPEESAGQGSHLASSGLMEDIKKTVTAEQVLKLEAGIARIRTELEELQREFGEFKSQK